MIFAKIKERANRFQFMWIAIFFLWMKTYLIYKIGYKITSENVLQEFLLFINPLSSCILLMAVSLLFKGKWRQVMTIILSLVGTFVLYANLVYYRFFTDFITWPLLFQKGNAQDLKGSVIELAYYWDLLLLVDIGLLMYILFNKKFPRVAALKFDRLAVVSLAIVVFMINLTIAQIERPQLLKRSFDREMLVKYIGTFNFHIYDGYLQLNTKTQKVLASSSDIQEVKNYTRSNYKKPDESLFGIAEGKNIIVLSLESLQTFVMNKSVNGEEITPFLNKLINESYYFDNFYHQTSQGKTSDSEFIVNNSLFGKNSGAVFFTHAGNKYRALPSILNEAGYHTSVMHANNKSFWNRDVMYGALGYDQFFDITYFDVNEENSVGWGLKDADFFEQSITYLKELPEPYYTKYITLTNHFPFELNEEDKFIDELETNSRTLNRYVTTVRYMDYALELFFERLKEEGLYEDTVFILYGDHNGISELHNNSMATFLRKEEISPFDSIQLQRVPMFIHIPGHEGNQILQTVGGQIDIKPTLLHLIGIENKEDIQFGTDLFSPFRNSFALLRDGSFITGTHVYTSDNCYSKLTGEIVETTYCEPYFQKAKSDLHYSDKMIYGDLFRFEQ